MNETVCLNGILNETESYYDRYWRDMEFASKLLEQNQEMERFINEALIKASGDKKSINEMTIINESINAEKIKGFFEKIKNFFKKIFDKFTASLNNLILEQKKYIDKYANIIIKCKYVATDVSEVKDYFKGLPRIIDVVDHVDEAILGRNFDVYFKPDSVPASDGNEIKTSERYPYDDATKINEAIKNPPERIDINEIQAKAIETFISNGYWSQMADFEKPTNGDNIEDEFKKSIKDYFNGSEDNVTWSTEHIDKNFQTIINTTYSAKSYLNRISTIKNNIEKKMDDAEKQMDDYYKQQKQKILDGIKVNNTDSSQLSKDDPEANWNKARVTADGKREINGEFFSDDEEGKKKYMEKATKSPTSESYIYESPVAIDNSNNNTGNKDNAEVNPNTGKTQLDNAGKAAERTSKLNAKNAPYQAQKSATKNVTKDNQDETIQNANTLLDTDIWNRQSRANADIRISSMIARTIFDSFKLINQDFWWIIQRHVQWYLANPGAETKNEYQRQKNYSLNMNAGTERVKLN